MDAIRIIGECEIAKLHLEQGDILVVKALVTRLTDEAVMRIKAHVTPKLPQGVQCLVIDSAIELSVLTRAEIEAKVA